MKLVRYSCVLGVLALLVLPITGIDQDPFDDAPGDECLGPEDPFCPGDGGTGGGGGWCWKCGTTFDENGQPVSFSCDKKSGGKTECELKVGPEGAECEVKGTSC